MSTLKTLEKYKPNGNPFSSFAWFPPRVNFATQEEKEKIVLLLRQHWVTNLGWIIACVFFTLLPYLFFSIKEIVLSGEIIDFFTPQVVFVLLSVWYLLVFGFMFSRFIHWYYNVYIVTTRRIIDVDFYGVLYKKISEADLNKIQDVTHTTIGTMELLFNFGEVRVQTAAEFSDIEFENVPNPSDVHKVIGELITDNKH